MPGFDLSALKTTAPTQGGTFDLSGLGSPSTQNPTAPTLTQNPSKSLTQVTQGAITELSPGIKAITQGLGPVQKIGQDLQSRAPKIGEALQRQFPDGLNFKSGIQAAVQMARPGLFSAFESLIKGKQQAPETALQIAGQAGGAIAEPIFEGVANLAGRLIPDDLKEAVKVAMAPLGEALQQEDIAAGIQGAEGDVKKFLEENPRIAANMEGVIGVFEATGVTEGALAAKELFKEAPRLLTLLKQAPEEARGLVAGLKSTKGLFEGSPRERIATLEAKAADALENSMVKVSTREEMAGLTPDVKRRIQGKGPELERYFKQAEARNINDTELSALGLGAEDTKKVFGEVQAELNKTGGEIGKFRKKMGSVRTSPEEIQKAVEILDTDLESKGLIIKDGKYRVAKGRDPLFSPVELKELQSMRESLINLKGDPSAIRIIDVRNKIQKNIDFGKESRQISGELDAPAKKTRASLAEINRNLIGNEQAQKLEDFANLADLVDEFNKVTSKGRNYEFFLKRLLSERDRIPKGLVNRIKEITKKDLMDIATFTQIATELVGGQAQKSVFRREIERAGLSITDLIAGGPAVKARAGYHLAEGLLRPNARKIFLRAAEEPKAVLKLKAKINKLKE